VTTFAQNPFVVSPGGFGVNHDYSITCTAGNTVVLMISGYSDITSVTLLGGSGTLTSDYTNGTERAFSYANLPSGVTGVRVTTSGGESDTQVVVFEIDGEASFDAGASMPGDFGNAVTATVVTTETDDVLVARWPTGGNTFTPDSGYAQSATVANYLAEYNSSALGAPASEVIGGSFSGSASYSGFAVAYTDAGGGIEAVAADTLTVSDSAVSVTARVSVGTDTNTPTDSAVSITARLAEATDSLALSDSAEGLVALPAVAEDSISLSDSAEGVSARVAVAEDTVTFTDAAAVGIEVEAEAEDSLTLTDSAVGSIAPPPPPPAPPSVLPLPAKLLGWAPGKRPKKGAAKTGNVVFKPAREEREEEVSRTGVEPAADELNLPTLASPAVVLGLDVPPPFSLGELALPPLPVFAPPPIAPAPLPAAAPPLPAPITVTVAAPPVEPVEPPTPTSAAQLIDLANRVAQEREETIALRDVVPALRDAVAELRANRDADLKRQRDTLADKVASGLVAVAALVTAGAKPSTVRAALRRVAEDVGRSGAIPPEPSDLEAENQRRREATQKILDALPED
jgi:hypothetical protein